MQVSIAYSEPAQQLWLRIEVPEDATLLSAIQLSGILQKFTEIDLETHKVGIFGKLAELDGVLRPGDRVEIYRPIFADPATVPRRQMAEDDDD
jgi:uncharacterized protein